VLYISQDNWLNGVNIQTAGTIGLGFTSYFFQGSTVQFFNPSTNTIYFEVALGNVTDWTPYSTGASMTSTASITFN
jgi:hypothetical protein